MYVQVITTPLIGGEKSPIGGESPQFGGRRPPFGSDRPLIGGYRLAFVVPTSWRYSFVTSVVITILDNVQKKDRFVCICARDPN